MGIQLVFPETNWLGSLLLAAYLIGFVQLFIWVFDMEEGAERSIAFLAVWFGYGAPFALFWAAIGVGHAKLMEKRKQALH